MVVTGSTIRNKTSRIEIYADGACRGNPGIGGWGAVLRSAQHEKQIYGFAADTTNNQMELQAVIEALTLLKKPSDVIIYTDSKYVCQGMTQWLAGWKRNQWKNSSKKPVKNQAHWQQLDKLANMHQITWQWVKGHAGIEGNELADQLANRAIDEALQKG